ncbi:type IV pilus biogenesis protein PilM [Geobacter sp. DSM 9736]|uniref:type IV pilus biogenesis protein PilM n=1 Tax=Geobacter sp. DSM 9736 TaxID=1277350 RepID=UPI000B5023A3|nr:pilus assembly protein PilM [Geobacter sp. DSM 9736]SNB45278.1 type IV pilus assembly protein PilM [Geobacter sp. DSM 9736]
MLFSRKAVGLEICQEGVKMVSIMGDRERIRVDSFSNGSFGGDTLKLSLREQNVLNPAGFVATVRETYLRLLTKVEQVSVSLPDSIGRVMLVDLETRVKNREEGANLIRWKLKKNFPFDISDAHLDYQILQEKETGEVTALVSLISRTVLHQYEDLLGEAGLQPGRIDFTTFNLYSLFSKRIDLADNAALLTCYDEIVSILIFYGGVLTFYRAKEIPGGMRDANRIYREINSSLLVYNDKFPNFSVGEVFYIASPFDAESFGSVVAEALAQEPVLLDVGRLVTFKNESSADRAGLFSLAAALGAAVRSF